MNAIVINKDKIILELSQDELGVLCCALNEVCDGIEEWEFETRMGIKIEDARIILDFLYTTYISVNQASSP